MERKHVWKSLSTFFFFFNFKSFLLILCKDLISLGLPVNCDRCKLSSGKIFLSFPNCWGKVGRAKGGINWEMETGKVSWSKSDCESHM